MKFFIRSYCLADKLTHEHWAVILQPSAAVVRYITMDHKYPWVYSRSNIGRKISLGPYQEKSKAEAVLERVMRLGQHTNWLVEGF